MMNYTRQRQKIDMEEAKRTYPESQDQHSITIFPLGKVLCLKEFEVYDKVQKKFGLQNRKCNNKHGKGNNNIINIKLL